MLDGMIEHVVWHMWAIWFTWITIVAVFPVAVAALAKYLITANRIGHDRD